MGRPKGGTNRFHSKEEKLVLVMRNLNGETATDIERETGIYHAQIHKLTKQYLQGGEKALVNKRKLGNPLFKYTRKKELTQVEQLEYKVALLERELLKKDAEVTRLKKINRTRKGRCQKKVIQQIYACIERESESHSIKELCEVYDVSRSG